MLTQIYVAILRHQAVMSELHGSHPADINLKDIFLNKSFWMLTEFC